MKKFLDLFSKWKRNQENFYNFYDASLPSNINNELIETNIFQYFPFDSESYETNEADKNSLNSRLEDISNSEELLVHFLSSLNKVTPILTILGLLDFQPHIDSIPTRKDSYIDESVMKTDSGEKNKLDKEYKVRKNVYFININNSKYFHIGLQKTINVNEKPFIREYSQGFEVQHWLKNCSPLKVDHQNLFNCEGKLAEKYVSLISHHVDDSWKEFLMYLGLGKTALEILESRNDNNKTLSVYDALQKYIARFPDTSIGFIIYALNEIHQVVVIEKLVKELIT